MEKAQNRKFKKKKSVKMSPLELHTCAGKNAQNTEETNELKMKTCWMVCMVVGEYSACKKYGT